MNQSSLQTTTDTINTSSLNSPNSKSFNNYKRTRKKNIKSSTNTNMNLNSSDSDTFDNVKSQNMKPKLYKSKIKNLNHQHQQQLELEKPLLTNIAQLSDVVLFKYNKLNDDLNMNLLKAKQLQKKREMRSVLLFVFFLFITILTLSQILVMHSQKNNSNFSQIKQMQEELKLMDYSIDKMLKENFVLPMQVWYSLKHYNDNLKKFSSFIDDFSYSYLMHNNSNTSSTILRNYLSSEELIADLAKCSLNKTHFETNIFKNLIELLNTTITSNKMLTNNETSNTTNTAYENLDNLIRNYVNSTSYSSNDIDYNDNCLQTVLFGYYYLFSEQYTNIFEKNSHLRYILANRNTIVNKTLESFLDHSKNNALLPSFEVNQFLKFPLRNIEDIGKRYQKTKTNYFNSSFKLCDPQPPILFGALNITEKKHNKLMMDILERDNYEVNTGGYWSPKNCQARHKIAIIIPYRDRLDHLITLLYYLHPILQRQQLEYKIYVSEQFGNGTFNKAIIMNAAFIYAFDEDNYNCYCFHDVDLVPEDDRNMYSCGRNPKHMSIGVDEMNYKLQYEELIGGVLILKTEHLIASNGYSNLYWGWGAEDDDLYYRLKGLGYKIERPPLKIGRYRMMKHQKRKPQLWSKRAKLLYSSVNRMTWDGISSANYTLLKVTVHKLYTHLLIDVGVPPAGFN